MTRFLGRAPKGKRLKAAVPFGHSKIETFIAGPREDRLVAPFVIDRPMNRQIFELYVRTQLAPTLLPGDVVIADNLAAHKSPAVEQAIAERGAWLLFLPPYFLRPQPHRNGLRQTQGPPAKARCPHHRRSLARHRPNLRPLPARRMPQLLQGCRICPYLIANRSSRLLKKCPIGGR